MKITKCDYCKKIIEGDVYALGMRNTSRLTMFKDFESDICEDCYQ